MKKFDEIKNRLQHSRLFKDSFWALFGSGVGKGLSLIAGVIVARFLGKEIYGEYGMIKNTLTYIAAFSTLGLGYSATKYIAEFYKTDPAKTYGSIKYAREITLISSSIMALALFIFATPVARFLDASHLSNTFRLTSLSLILNAVNTTQIGILSGFGEYKVAARNQSIAGIATFFTSAAFTYFWSIDGAIVALVASFALNCILNAISISPIKKSLNISNYGDAAFRKEIIKFSIPIACQESLYSISHWGISFVLIKLASYGELGLYSAAVQWAGMILFIPAVLRNVTLSHLSGNLNDVKSHKRTLNTMLGVNFISTTIPFLVVCLFANIICSFYGAEFVGLKPVLLVYVFSTIFSCLSNVYTQEYMSRGRTWFLFWSRVLRDGANILLGVILIKIFVQEGAALMFAIATVVAQIIYFVILHYSLNGNENQ